MTRPADLRAWSVGVGGALCSACLDELPSASDPCARPDCPHAGPDGHGRGAAQGRQSARTPTRPSLVDGPRAEVVAPREVHPAPHIGTRPSLAERRGPR